MAEVNFAELKKQIEYYLSDNNLKQDEFFYNKIKDSSDNSIPIESLLNCNKVKKLSATKDDIVKAIADSIEIETSGDGSGIKRKNNKALPEFEPKVTKKLKTEGGSGGAHKEESKHEPKEDKGFDPQIFRITLSKADEALNWKKVEEEIKNASGVKICYTRVNGTEGHFAVNRNTLTEEEKGKLVNGDVKIGDVEVKVDECLDEYLKKFYADHGKHLDSCLERSGLKRKQKFNKGGAKPDNSVDFVFNNQRYTNLTPLKNQFNNIIQSTMDDDVVGAEGHKLLVELLKYHENGDAKIRDLKHFTVGQHPSYKQTRCFFVVREDGTKEDFSLTKCLNSIRDKKNVPEEEK